MIIQNLYKSISSRYRVWRNPTEFARGIGVQIGRDCRLIAISASTFGSEPYLVKLGDHVTVTSGVKFITHDGGVWVFRKEEPRIEVLAPIHIGDNVFIGVNSVILPGSVIGSNVVIGACSLVKGEVPGNTVVAGVPAHEIKSLDQYRASIQENVTMTRDLTPLEKRSALDRRFPS